MTPQAFTFKLSVPNDPESVAVVTAMAAHAAEYAQVDAGKAAAFVERVRGTATQALQPGSSSHCTVVFGAEAGQLTITLGSHSVSEPLPN